jgi:insulysin
MQSKRPLDEMQELVVASFSAIKSESNTELLQSKPVEEIFKPEFFTNMIYMKPKTATKTMRITWIFPSMQKNYKCSPFEYLSKIFGNDGVGGIQKYLQEQQLITQLSFHNQSNSFGGNSQFCMPKLGITLTDSGAANIDKILEAIFSYLIMLKETPIEEHRRLYNEFQEQRDLGFKFHRESTALRNVNQIAPNMLIYEDVDIIRGGSLFQNFDEDLIVDTIEKLNQRKFNLLISNNEHETFRKKEKYFDAEYDEVEFPEEYQKLWYERKANSEFYLEKPNPFKATNFEVFVNDEESPVSFS